MSTHNICFYGGIRKIIPELSSNTLEQVLYMCYSSDWIHAVIMIKQLCYLICLFSFFQQVLSIL